MEVRKKLEIRTKGCWDWFLIFWGLSSQQSEVLEKSFGRGYWETPSLYDYQIFVFFSFCPMFLSSINEVSTGPTSQFLWFCVYFRPFFSRCLIGWYIGFWQWFWNSTYPTRCFELGWAVPHSDFLNWLSSAALKIFISGVSSRMLML